jgi:hypothetical protein
MIVMSRVHSRLCSVFPWFCRSIHESRPQVDTEIHTWRARQQALFALLGTHDKLDVVKGVADKADLTPETKVSDNDVKDGLGTVLDALRREADIR